MENADAAALRAVPAETVLGKSTLGFGGGGPVIDGKILRQTPLEAFRDGHIPRMPVLIGSNNYEAGSFAGLARGALEEAIAAMAPDRRPV